MNDSAATPGPAERRISVLCADDSADIAMMLRVAINRQSDLECAGCVESGEALLGAVAAMKPRPSIAVVDLTMPDGGISPLDAIRQLSQSCPECRAIVYSGYDGPEVMDGAKRAGAWGCVSKHSELKRLFEAIRRVASGHTFFDTGTFGGTQGL